MRNNRILIYIISGVLIFSAFCFCTVSAHANEPTRYIVKVKNNSLKKSVRSNESDNTKIFDNIYLTNDIDTFRKSHIVEFYIPDYEAELYDMAYPASTSDTLIDEQWALTNIKAKESRLVGLTGRNVKIGVVDSGVDFNHRDFNKNNIIDGCNCIIDQETGEVLDNNDYGDLCGHGTMVTGIIAAQIDNQLGIAGLADNALIMPIKVTNGDTLYLSSILLGIKTAIEHKCDIINLSLGGTFKDDPDAIKIFQKIINEAEDAGIIVIAAVGNSGNATLNYPAGFEQVIGVGSFDKNNEISWFSQVNESVFITAPGEDILSLYPDDMYVMDLGTSMSAPIVTAVAALVKEAIPTCTPAQFRQILKSTAEDIGEEGYDCEYGYGKVNIQNIVNYIKDYIPNVIVTQGIYDSVKQIYIYNNFSDIIKANAYLASYNNCTNALKSIDIISDISINTGVMNIPYNNNYDCLFLWDNKMRPYVEKYLLNSLK